uniref:Prenylcysteine oxidase 1 n=1 Tax=Malurus cyaneus samueli TaxID=2593467 RepID=A0A8C5TL11_9PASS
MKHFVKELGLSVSSGQGSLAGVYNGEEFVFEESSWSFINLFKLLWHYGFNPLRMSMWVEDILDKFMRWVGVPCRCCIPGRVQSGLWSVKGGTNCVQRPHLLSKAEVIPATVVSMEPKTRPSCTRSLQHILGADRGHYDIVLIAAPLGHRMATSTSRTLTLHPEFHNHHQTALPGARALEPSFFGYQDPRPFTWGHFTTNNPKLSSTVWHVCPRSICSSPPTTRTAPREQLNLLFSSYDSVGEAVVGVSEYSAPEKFPPMLLHEHLYYLNGLERAASAMEMSAIAARNAALLAFHRWHGHSASVDQEDLHAKLKTEL